MNHVETWEDMRTLLTEEFGGNRVLRNKKKNFRKITLKPSESLYDFINRFYNEATPLINSGVLTYDDAFDTLSTAISHDPKLGIFLETVKYQVGTICELKDAFQDIAEYHTKSKKKSVLYSLEAKT